MLVDHPFTKSNEIIQKFKETEDSRYIYQNKLDKDCFQEDMAMEISKIQVKKRLLIKYCRVKHLMLLNFQNVIGIKEVLLPWFIDFLKKKRQL